MKVWLLQTGEPLPGIAHMRPLRTAMLASALATAGHEVAWWTSTFHHYTKEFVAKPFETRTGPDGVELRFLPGYAYTRNTSLRRYWSHIRVARSFRRAAEHHAPPDLVVPSMPDYHLAAEAVSFATSHGAPTVLDIRDKWPDIFLDVVPRAAVPAARFALTRDRAMLARTVRSSTSVVSMMDELLEWALDLSQRPRGPLDRVFPLGGLPLGDAQGEPSRRVAEAIEQCRGRTVVTYVGTFGAMTDPSIIVGAARAFAEGPVAPVSFLLAGAGPGFKRVVALARGLPHVHFVGHVDGSDLAAVLGATDIAVVPTPKGYQSFQNKAFTYLSAGLPILTSATGGLATAIDHWGFGLRYEADDSRELAHRIAELAADPARLNAMAAAATRAFRDEYSAHRVYGRFVRFLEEVVRNPPAARVHSLRSSS